MLTDMVDAPRPSLREMLARMGEENARARAARRTPPLDAGITRRVEECLVLYEDLQPLRFQALCAALGSAAAARQRLREQQRHAEADQEAALMRIQARLYGPRP